MKALGQLVLFLLFLPLAGLAHPGIALVKDSKGTLYYSDLQHVWKIKNGRKTMAVRRVHTHELFLDAQDNLYGKNEQNQGDTFFHYLWRLSPTGVLDTVLHSRQAYVTHDFALARDLQGNEYYTKEFTSHPDTTHLFRKTPTGQETVYATGSFKGVRWWHPQADGSVLYVKNNTVYQITSQGKVLALARNIGNARPSFAFSGNSITVWGLWQDQNANVYAAVFSDQAVKKITPAGKVSVYYKSKGNWAPTQGLFDDQGQLWLMESSDKNEIRVHLAVPKPSLPPPQKGAAPPLSFFLLGLGLAAVGALGIWYVSKRGGKVFS